MNRRPGYTYFIFTDDDVSLKFNSAATPDMKHFSPTRIFQDWLLDYEPAVGVVDFEEQKEGQKVRNKIKTNCGITNSASVANPTIFFDPLFNAFHARTAHHIFRPTWYHTRKSELVAYRQICLFSSGAEISWTSAAVFFQWPLKTYYIAVIQDRLEELEKLGKSLFKSSNRGHLPNMWTKVYSTNSGKIHLVT